MNFQDGLSGIMRRCSAQGHDMGPWEIVTYEGFDYLQARCTRCRAVARAERDGRLVPESSAVSMQCLPMAVLA